jgi:hypothetical protein
VRFVGRIEVHAELLFGKIRTSEANTRVSCFACPIVRKDVMSCLAGEDEERGEETYIRRSEHNGRRNKELVIVHARRIDQTRRTMRDFFFFTQRLLPESRRNKTQHEHPSPGIAIVQGTPEVNVLHDINDEC